MKSQESKIRSHGRGTRSCRRCGTHRGIIRRADLMICRRCMREIATNLGFKKTGSRGG
ncbi:MAG: 30S ribosomal protein S14 [Candidatus Heimdallarchaeota archaeon]|nr:30S ribosomal protein S14 [Candidatus Heimdallarchaeota archaeon]MDH5646217.1 30S ribosomal protein S14 [Candidatus Heimdallarchaeota archaeon]